MYPAAIAATPVATPSMLSSKFKAFVMPMNQRSEIAPSIQ